MQFTIPTVSALLLLAGQAAAGVTIAFHQSNYGCSNTPIYTRYDTPNNYCIAFSDNLLSIRFSGIPSGAKGQVYGNDCSDYKGETTGGCIGASGSAFRGANWFYPWKRSTPLQRRQTKERFGVFYTLPDGKTVREVEVTAEDLKRALKLVEDKDYAALAELPDVSYGC